MGVRSPAVVDGEGSAGRPVDPRTDQFVNPRPDGRVEIQDTAVEVRFDDHPIEQQDRCFTVWSPDAAELFADDELMTPSRVQGFEMIKHGAVVGIGVGIADRPRPARAARPLPSHLAFKKRPPQLRQHDVDGKA